MIDSISSMKGLITACSLSFRSLSSFYFSLNTVKVPPSIR